MKIFPVLDLLEGTVVRGVAGKRNEYRPVESCLVAGSDPLAVAEAFREQLGLKELYLADLDAILHDRPNVPIYRKLIENGFELIVDAGLRDVTRARLLIDHDVSKVIAGLETAPGPEFLKQLTNACGPERVIFSLDLKQGEALGNLDPWGTSDPYKIGLQAVQSGITRMIVLDLAAVGVSDGVFTLELCRKFQQEFPELKITTGGGVRNGEDLKLLAESGIDAVLVASALHDGRIDAETIRRFHS